MNPDQIDFRALNPPSRFDSKPSDSQESGSDHSAEISEILGRMVSAIEQQGTHHSDDAVPWLSLLTAGRRHRTCAFSVNPVLTDLVRAILGRSAALNNSANESMIEFVSETLFANADSRARLLRMWEHLQEVLENEHP